MDDKRVIGERNAIATLTGLHRFGWVTSRMVSELVWPGRTQAVPLARRMLAKLVDQRLAVKRELGKLCATGHETSGESWLG